MISAPAETNDSNTESHNNGSLIEDDERGISKSPSGYIFMCNQTTKLECFQNRVFGLPLGKKGVVEEIKPGTKLFLFDFEKKLLYGVYEATSAGNLNLEPAAFGGRFPAQVKFRIFKECFPLPESSLRNIIKDNYTGGKFKQDLSIEQVTNLISSFHPLGASPSQPAAQAWPHGPHVYVPRPVPPEVMEYLPEFTERDIRLLAEPQPKYVEHGSQVRAASGYYVAHHQPPLFANDFFRYPTPHNQITSLEMQYRQLPQQREAVYQNNLAANSNSNSTAADPYIPSVMQTQPSASYYQPTLQSSQHQYSLVETATTSVSGQQTPAAYFSLPREALHQDSMSPYISNSTAYYDSPALHTQAPVHQPPLPGSWYQDRVAAYSSNRQAPPQYTASALQPQVHPTYLPPQSQAFYQEYNSNATVPAQYTPITLPQVNAGNLPQQSEAPFGEE